MLQCCRQLQRQGVRARQIIHAVLVGTVAATPVAHGHFAWIEVSPESPATNSSLAAQVSFGHGFDPDFQLDEDRIDAFRIYKDDVQSGSDLRRKAAAEYETALLDDTGLYVLTAKQTSAYWTRTPTGGFRKPKSEVDDAVRCTQSSNTAKASVRTGNPDKYLVDTIVGHRLEIVPVDQSTLSDEGGRVVLQVLFDEQPHAGPVRLYRKGASDNPIEEVESDANGQVTLHPDQGGYWMVHAQATLAYPDPDVCDNRDFNATLTFHLNE